MIEEEIDMTYNETGFRALYHNICAFPLKENLKSAVKDFPGAEKANCILVYGYIDKEAGLTLEILACGQMKDDKFKFFDSVDDIRSFIRIGAVKDDEFFYFDDPDSNLQKRYSKKIELLHHYNADEEVEKTREMAFLDGCRDEGCIDDVLVYLMKDGLKPEGCWTRIIGLGDHFFMGTLLNEPDQDFGYHLGEKIAFFVQETEDKKIICYSNMNPSVKLKTEDLEDGTMLKEAIVAFNKERNEEHFIEVLELLRDSYVWVPCNAIMSDEDQERISKLVEGTETDEDLQKIVGETFTTQDDVRLVPDILQNGDDFFFPAFSSAEEMGEYGNGFSKVEKHMFEVINLARNNEKDLAGIIINAFSVPFVLEKEIFDMVEKMKSRIVEDK